MLERKQCEEAARKFKSANGIEISDENAIAAFHLMNTHGVDTAAALDQSSRSGHDHGIDAWYYAESENRLYIYQSKMSEGKGTVLKGLSDLASASDWLVQVIGDGALECLPSGNHCLYNLFMKLGEKRERVRHVSFILISPFSEDELEDRSEIDDSLRELSDSRLNSLMRDRGGSIILETTQFNLTASLPSNRKRYRVDRIPKSTIHLRKNAHLELAYVPLYNLVDLFRQRGSILFDKNVRLSLYNAKDAKDRIVHPMEETLDAIVSGRLDPSIFPFYHVGITLFSPMRTEEDQDILSLEAPSVINGCQTITIANEFLKRLEAARADDEKIARFKEIKVVAKLVVGVSSEELREITNSNNRQAPIENWQLFSNEPVHIEIEAALKDIGMFYERQRGKFEAVMRTVDSAARYMNTNGTYVRITDLGQIICLARGNTQWAAKQSEIFLNGENHKTVFDKDIPKYPRDIVFLYNIFKSMKRGLNKYLQIPAHSNDYTQMIYRRPIVRAYVYYLVLQYYYQRREKSAIRSDYSTKLLKIASPALTDDLQGFYQKIITKIKNWYLEQSKQLAQEVSQKKLEAFMKTIAMDLGIDEDGPQPFSSTAHEWGDE